MSAAVRLNAPRTEASPWYTSSPYEPLRPPIENLKDIDLMDPELYAFGDPHSAWRLLRERAPVFWHERSSPGTENKGFWVLSRYDDCAAVYKNPKVFTSVQGPFLDLRVDQTPVRMLASLDGPEHRERRALVSRYFTPNALMRHTDAVRSVVTSLLDAVAERGECDFSSDIAAKLPLVATCELLGISPAEGQHLADMLFAVDPHAPEALQKYNDAALEFFAEVIAERRRGNTRESIADIIAHAQLDGQPLPEHETLHMMWILFFGGIDSTVHAATGGLLALFHHPDQLAILRSDPSLVSSAVDEILRWTSTSHANKRKALQDIEIRGTLVKKDDYVSMWSPSANRDELAF
ncbi:MAG: cytochrome P450, partial [Steroidobacteraceae bacterium]